MSASIQNMIIFFLSSWFPLYVMVSKWNLYTCTLEYYKSKCQIENNTLCVYAIGFKRSTMLAFIYHRHSMAYDPILRVSNRD